VNFCEDSGPLNRQQSNRLGGKSTISEKRWTRDKWNAFELVTMCDSEELEFEDFEVMLNAIARLSRESVEQTEPKVLVPQVVAVTRRK
jgi:hypothetical protein